MSLSRHSIDVLATPALSLRLILILFVHFSPLGPTDLVHCTPMDSKVVDTIVRQAFWLGLHRHRYAHIDPDLNRLERLIFSMTLDSSTFLSLLFESFLVKFARTFSSSRGAPSLPNIPSLDPFSLVAFHSHFLGFRYMYLHFEGPSRVCPQFPPIPLALARMRTAHGVIFPTFFSLVLAFPAAYLDILRFRCSACAPDIRRYISIRYSSFGLSLRHGPFGITCLVERPRVVAHRLYAFAFPL